jgi:hypothetical protein
MNLAWPMFVSNRNPAASRVALVASLPDILIFSGVAPSFAFAANFSFAQQALSALRDQSINQILYDGTPHEKNSSSRDRRTF